MNTVDVRRLTAWSGLITGGMTVLIIPLYFTNSGVPPTWNVLTRSLITILSCATFVVFLAGLRHLIRQADQRYEWLAGLVYGAGLIYLAVVLVATSLEAGGVIGTPEGTLDPTIDGPLAHGTVLLHGSVARVVTAVLLLAAGHAVLRTRALPAWAGRSAYVVAAVNLAFAPSLYFGMDPAQFYSAVGWGNTALTGSLVIWWAVAASIGALSATYRS
jgi:hypothetical protein